jgi:hypothetical protein
MRAGLIPNACTVHAPHEEMRRGGQAAVCVWRRCSWRAQPAGKTLVLPPAASLTKRDPRRAHPQPLGTQGDLRTAASSTTATATTATAAAALPPLLLPPLPLPLMTN